MTRPDKVSGLLLAMFGGPLINGVCVLIALAVGLPFWAGWVVGLPLCFYFGYRSDDIVEHIRL